MILPQAPTVPNPDNVDTFDSLAYPFTKWIKSVASITNTDIIFGEPLKKQTFYTLQSSRMGIIDMGGTFTPANGRTFYIPLFIRSDIKISELSVYAIKAGGNIKMCIAKDLNGFPNSILAQTASVSVSTTGWKSLAIQETTLSEGNMYWCGFTRDTSNTLYAENSTDNFSIALGTTFTDPQRVISSSALYVVETYANAFTTFLGFAYQNPAPYIIQKGTLI